MHWLLTITFLLLCSCAPRAHGPPAFAQQLAYEAAVADIDAPNGPRQVFGSIQAAAALIQRGSRFESTACADGWLFRLHIDARPTLRFFFFVPRSGGAGFSLSAELARRRAC